MMITQHGGSEGKTYVVDQFEAKDLGAPFKVILHKAVRVTHNPAGELMSYRSRILKVLSGLLL